MHLLKERRCFMKKKFLCAFVLVACFLLTACGLDLSNASLKLNESKENGDWIMTMKKIEYSETYCNLLNNQFLTSSETFTEGDSEYVCILKKAESNKGFLLFELDLEYIGKNNISEYMDDFLLDYNDGYEVSPETVYISANKEDWIFIDGESINHSEVSIDPLENTKFTIRGAFEINEKIEKDTDSNLILELPFGFKYEIR